MVIESKKVFDTLGECLVWFEAVKNDTNEWGFSMIELGGKWHAVAHMYGLKYE